MPRVDRSRRLPRNKRGASSVEYGLLAGLIAAGALFSVDRAGESIVCLLSASANRIGAVTESSYPSECAQPLPDAGIVQVTGPAGGDYRPGDTLTWRIEYDRDVAVDLAGGTPVVPVEIGGAVVDVPYVSGSGGRELVFEYVVPGGTSDADGIAVSGPGVDEAGGDLAGESGGEAETDFAWSGGGVTIGQDPYVTGVVPPLAGSYVPGDAIEFDVVWSEPVDVDTSGGTPAIDVDVGGTTRQAEYVGGDGTDTTTWRYVVQTGDGDDDGIEIGGGPISGGAIAGADDGGSAHGEVPATSAPSATVVDGPYVSGYNPPAAGTYAPGDPIEFDVVWSEPVNVDTSGGAPTIDLVLDSGTVTAEYVGGDGTDTHTYRYVPQSGDQDADGSIGVGGAISGGGLAGGDGDDASRDGPGDVFAGVNVVPVAQTGELLASQPGHDSSGGYGYAVDMDGTLAVVGSWKHDIGGLTNNGAAYVFDVTGSGAPTELSVGSLGLDDHLGRSVAIDGGRVVVGAYRADTAGSDSGAAFVFSTAGTLTGELTPSDHTGFMDFGDSSALSGTTAVVGAPAADGVVANAGKVYLFDAAAGNTTETRSFVASDGMGDDRFGHSVATDGSLVVIGAPFADPSGSESGAVYVFNASGGFVEKLVSPSGAAGARFGTSVAVDAGRILVGAEGENTAYLYDTGRNLAATLTGSGGDFGSSVSIEGGLAVVGAASGGGSLFGGGSGEAYLFDAATGETIGALAATGIDVGDEFGRSAATSGGRVLVGAPQGDGQASGTGNTYLFE